MSNSLLEKYYVNSSRVYLDRFAERAGVAARSLGQSPTVLDAGAGTSPYRKHFTGCTYEAADFCQLERAYEPLTYVCDLKSIPVGDCKYELIFCTQVLEHVQDPLAVLRELFRVLKPNGQLWLSAPLFYPEHEVPYDYYRYTQFGLAHLLATVGFTNVTTRWLEGYLGTLAFELKLAARCLNKGIRSYPTGVRGVFFRLFCALLNPVLLVSAIILSKADLTVKIDSVGHCKNYTAVATKPN